MHLDIHPRCTVIEGEAMNTSCRRERFDQTLGAKFLRMVKHRGTRQVGESPPLETFYTWLDKALGSLI